MRRMPEPAAVFASWALAGTAVMDRTASAIPAATLVLEINRFCIFIPPPLFAERLLPIRAIQQFLDKFHALEIQDLGILFLTPVQRHADLPWAGEDVRIFYG